jgi:hypothetical protein
LLLLLLLLLQLLLLLLLQLLLLLLLLLRLVVGGNLALRWGRHVLVSGAAGGPGRPRVGRRRLVEEGAVVAL